MTDESLFREVDEEVRRQQLENLWKRWGNLIIAGVVVVFAGVAGFKGWQYYEQRKAEEGAATYFAALRLDAGGKADESAKRLSELAAGPHAGYALLARLEEAANLGKAGKTAEAVKAYDAIAADPKLDPATRNAVRVRAAILLVDTAPVADLTARVGDLNTTESAWRNEAREILGFAAYRAGDYLSADKFMNEILSDPEAPPNMQQRAMALVSLLAPRLDKPQPTVQ